MPGEHSNFIPAEWLSDHYRTIGGTYDTFESALAAVERHFNNKHGGGGHFQIFRPDETHGTAAVVEASPVAGDPYATRSVYKVIVGHAAG